MSAVEAFTPLQLTEANLKQASLIWVEYKDASLRAADGNAELLLKRNNAMNRVDYLLETYFLELINGDGHGIPTA